MEAFIKVFNNLKTDDELFEIHKIFVDKALDFNKGQSGILLNGRIIGKSNFQFFNFTTRESAITYVDDLTLDYLVTLELSHIHGYVEHSALSCGWLEKKLSVMLTKYQFFCIAQGSK